MSPPSRRDRERVAARRESQPTLFIDRSLGRIELPTLLRAHGLTVVTLAEHYGIPADQDVADETWIHDSARMGWIALMKDARIRTRPAEAEAIRRSGARCFCLANANLTSADGAARYIANIDAIFRAARAPGPLLFHVHQNRIVRLRI